MQEMNDNDDDGDGNGDGDENNVYFHHFLPSKEKRSTIGTSNLKFYKNKMKKNCCISVKNLFDEKSSNNNISKDCNRFCCNRNFSQI